VSEPRRQDSPETSEPRYSGIRTFAQQENTRELAGVDVAVVGLPFDQGTSFRAGARFGPEAIRSASVLLRPYHQVHRLDLLGGQRVVDWGDAVASPGNAERGVGQLAGQLTSVVASGAVPLCLGGDHLVVLAELRALAARRGPLGLMLLDSHPDTWDSYTGERYFHGTPFRRALEEELIDPGRSLMGGMRGPLYSEEILTETREMGFTLVPWAELRAMPPERFADLARERLGDGPAFLSFDVDFVDPAFAPATGTPEPGGPTSAEAIDFVRALAGIDFAGFDVVEVSPPYDGPGQITAILAANLAYEMLGLAMLGDRR
jgi:agmatinase